jgi:Na+-translocating ferredoxin:NAD+ oxidoreductase RnfG subunit
MAIDWNPVILAIIALISTVIVTLIPVFITGFFNAHAAKLTALKAVVDANEAFTKTVITLVQQTMGTLSNDAKYKEAKARIIAELGLTDDQANTLLESVLGTVKMALGDAWDRLGGKAPATPPTPADPTIA